MRFAKYEGAGNDFVVLDRLTGGAAISAAQAIALCDRHRGIGADGVLTLLPAPGAAARMHIYNADGSEAAMCGNGVRCVVRYLLDAGRVEAAAPVRILTQERTVACAVLADGRVRVEMGVAGALATTLAPVAGGAADERAATIDGQIWRGTALSFGNPHFVLFVDAPPRELAERLGASLSSHHGFADRANVSFVRCEPASLEAVVYERGVGITQACGSGACAIGVAAVRRGQRREAETISVRLPGGVLEVVVGAGERVTLTGPARRVFAGDVDLGEGP